jgi:uncharacterized protein (TIGR02996 family)
MDGYGASAGINGRPLFISDSWAVSTPGPALPVLGAGRGAVVIGAADWWVRRVLWLLASAEERNLITALHANPGDRVALRAYADLCEEQGDAGTAAELRRVAGPG